jgi:hypothetical protein
LIALLLLAAAWLYQDQSADRAARLERGAGFENQRLAALRAATYSEPAAELSVSPEPDDSPPERDAVEADPEAGAPRCRLWGRTVDPEGRPIAGARVTMRHGTWSGDEIRVEPWWSVHGTQSYETTSAADGQFQVDALDRGRSDGGIEIDAPGYAPAEGWLVYPAPGDDGFMECVLFPCGTLELLVEDQDGQAIADLTGIQLVFDPRTMTTTLPLVELGAFDSQRGCYRLERVPTGPFSLFLKRGLGSSPVFGPFEVASGGVGRAGVQWNHPPPLGLRVTLAPVGYSTVVLRELGLPSTCIVLNFATGNRFSALEKNLPTLSLASDVPPGPLSVDFEAGPFEPMRGIEVLPGKRLRLPIRGRAAIALEVRDAGSGERLTRITTAIAIDRNGFNLVTQRGPLPANGILDALLPVEQTLLVAAPGFQTAELALEGLELDRVLPREVLLERLP